MNREIKFRAWDCQGVKMISFENEEMWDTNWLNTCYVMQYTGLKDKNGKEIYEGDILKHGNRKGYVYFNRSSWEFRFGKDLSEYLSFRHYDASVFEVIGNIYENPELLK